MQISKGGFATWVRSSLRSNPRWLLVALPAAVLGADLILFPFFEIAISSEPNIRTMSLLVKRRQQVGWVRGHRIEVGLDSVARPSYLGHLSPNRPNALVVSAFLRPKKEVGVGSYGRAVIDKLALLSPGDAERLRGLVASLGANAGSVRDLSLQLAPEHRQQLPIDHVLVVTMQGAPAHLNQQEEVLDRALPRILRRAAALHIDTLVLPVIGHNWQDESTFSFEYFFDTLFAAISPAAGPRRIHIDLYSEWPTPVLEEAVSELSASVRELGFQDDPLRLHRGHWRALLLFLSLCLLVCSFRVRLTVPSFAAITVAFTGFFLAFAPLIEIVVTGMPSLVAIAVQIFAYADIAIGFPIIVSVSPEGLFRKRRDAS